MRSGRLVGVCDYGSGNTSSVVAGLQRAGASVEVLASPSEIVPEMRHLVVPGVGAFGACLDRLTARGWASFILEQQIKDEIAILCICVGLQVLAEHGLENGRHSGMGLINTSVTPVHASCGKQHVGWSDVVFQVSSLGFQPGDVADFYFDHGFALEGEGKWCNATAHYGRTFCAVAQVGRIWGVQFHPELSGEAGEFLLRSFVVS